MELWWLRQVPSAAGDAGRAVVCPVHEAKWTGSRASSLLALTSPFLKCVLPVTPFRMKAKPSQSVNWGGVETCAKQQIDVLLAVRHSCF